jgi:hypothetical protein
MPYVMVPVPEEHVEEVMEFILRARARAALVQWDGKLVADLFERVDEATRSLLSVVARATLAQDDLFETDAAKGIEFTVPETLAIMRQVNDLAKEENHPPLVQTRWVSDTLPSGRVAERRVLCMDEDVAQLVRDAERAEFLASRNALESR